MFEISPKLAEETGIFIGDGCLCASGRNYLIKYDGNSIEDRTYFTKFLPSLLQSVYGITPIVRFEKNVNVCRVYFYSKDVAEFKHNVLGFPIGPKSHSVRIPKQLIDDEKNIRSLIRGYFDTDGCVLFLRKRRAEPYYPKVAVKSASKRLIKQLEGILQRFGFNYYVAYNVPNGACNRYNIHRLEVSGQKNFERWFREIGSNNERNLTKYAVWKKLGYCPSNIDIEQRFSMLGSPRVAFSFAKSKEGHG